MKFKLKNLIGTKIDKGKRIRKATLGSDLRVGNMSISPGKFIYITEFHWERYQAQIRHLMNCGAVELEGPTREATEALLAGRQLPVELPTKPRVKEEPKPVVLEEKVQDNVVEEAAAPKQEVVIEEVAAEPKEEVIEEEPKKVTRKKKKKKFAEKSE